MQVKSIRFHLSKKSALIVTKYIQAYIFQSFLFYRFKQLGRVSTFHFQASLPRLPLPKLRDTCQQYLTAQEGLLDKEAFATTNKLTQEFASKGSTGWSKTIQNRSHDSVFTFIQKDLIASIDSHRLAAIAQASSNLYKEEPQSIKTGAFIIRSSLIKTRRFSNLHIVPRVPIMQRF